MMESGVRAFSSRGPRSGVACDTPHDDVSDCCAECTEYSVLSVYGAHANPANVPHNDRVTRSQAADQESTLGSRSETHPDDDFQIKGPCPEHALRMLC